MRPWLLLLLLLLPKLAQATVLELNDWDNLTRPGWTYGGRQVEIENGTGTPSGGGALKFRYGEVDGNGVGIPTTQTESRTGGIVNWNASYPSEFYVGHWIKWSPNWLWHPTGSKIDYFMDNQSQAPPNDSFNIMVLVWGLEPGVILTPEPGCRGGIGSTPQFVWGTGSYNLPQIGGVEFCPGIWYWVQFHIKMSTPGGANGIFEFWVNNGPPIMSSFDVRMGGPTHNGQWSAFSHSPEYGGGGTVTLPTEQDIWMDHTVIATTKAETNMPGGGAGDPVPGPPAIPSGLTIHP